MGLSRDQAISQYGSESYTGWDPAAAVQDARAKGTTVNAGGTPTGGNTSGGSRINAQDTYNSLSQQYGLGDLKNTAKTLSDQINTIEDYLKKVEPDVQARSGGFLMTDPQQRRLIASESAPSQKNMADLSTSYGRVTSNIASIQGDIGTQMDLVMKDQAYRDSIATAAANVGVAITGNESPEDLLTAIAGKVNENDLWDKAFKEKQLAQSGSGGAAGKALNDQVARLKADVQSGVPFYELAARYSDLPQSQVRAEYNAGPMAKQWGPAKESSMDVTKATTAMTAKPVAPSARWSNGDGTYTDLDTGQIYDAPVGGSLVTPKKK